MKYKLILGLTLLLLVVGVACAVNFKNTADVTVDSNELTIDGAKVAKIAEYDTSDCIDKEILAKDDGAIIKQITKDGATEVDNIGDPNDAYEFLTNNGMYYTFGKDGKTYIVTIDVGQWKADMLTKMDNWCLANNN